MTAKSILMSFQIQDQRLADDDVVAKIKAIPAICYKDIGNVFELACKAGDKVYVCLTPNGEHTVIHVYEGGMVTVDVQTFQSNDMTTKGEEIAAAKRLEHTIKHWLGDVCLYSRCLPGQIRRNYHTPYYSTGDDRLYEYVDLQIVFEKDSKWQNIKIFRTQEFGNVLCLDDDLMIGESDIIYTKSLMGLDRNDFRDKTVLILGGGDGGLLYELLKEHPHYITMVEIDEEVIKACRKYMRGVCHDALDVLESTNYKVIIDDCMVILKEKLGKGEKFDYIINDLTEFSIDSNSFCTYDFSTTSTILEISSNLLAPGGKYLSRGNSTRATPFLNQYEKGIQKLGMEFRYTDVHVPSFMEKYRLYEVWNAQENM